MVGEESIQYCRAALFPNKLQARVAYLNVSRLIDLFEGSGGVYQFRVSDVAVVAIIGDQLPEELDVKIREVLDAGTLIELPVNVFRHLRELFYKESIPGVTRKSDYDPARTIYL